MGRNKYKEMIKNFWENPKREIEKVYNNEQDQNTLEFGSNPTSPENGGPQQENHLKMA